MDCNENNTKNEDEICRKFFFIWKKKVDDRVEETYQNLFGSDRESSSDEEDQNEDLKHDREELEIEEEEIDQNESEFWFIKLLNYRLPETFDPQSDYVYLLWVFFVALSFSYNACVIPFRTVFPTGDLRSWMIIDYICDAINLFDMIFIKVRLQYIELGQRETKLSKTKDHYYKSKQHKLDMLAVFPTDIIYPILGMNPIFRANRLLKMSSYVEFNNRFESVLKRAYIFRVARTTFYLLYFIHLDACLYYWISYMHDFKVKWGYNQLGIPYIRCYYYAFLTTVNIGNVSVPRTNFQLLFQLFSFFVGLFIFSVVIGQVRDSVQAATAEKEAYRRQKNACNEYMQRNNISMNVQNKVRSWFEYTWETQKILNESGMLEQMPEKMHKDLAINVHIGVLSKVEVFKECEKQVLDDLVLKLKPILYLPGDYICKKGEVGKEMYIISKGSAHVVGDNESVVFATLKPGTAFGEISLMSIGGGNKRTANIYSPGFTTLFVLHKHDFDNVVKQHPETLRVLRSKAKQSLMKDKNKKPRKSLCQIGSSRNIGSKFLDTVVKSGSKKNLKSLSKLEKALKNT